MTIEVNGIEADVLRDGLIYTDKVYRSKIANIKANIIDKPELKNILEKDLKLAEDKLTANHNLKNAFNLG